MSLDRILGRCLLALAPFRVLFNEPLTIIVLGGRGRGQQLPFGVGPWSWSLAIGTLDSYGVIVPRGGGKDQQLPFLVLGFGTLDSYSVFV